MSIRFEVPDIKLRERRRAARNAQATRNAARLAHAGVVRDEDGEPVELDRARAPGPRTAAQHTWRERHALKVLGVIMVVMFSLVLAVQVAC